MYLGRVALFAVPNPSKFSDFIVVIYFRRLASDDLLLYDKIAVNTFRLQLLTQENTAERQRPWLLNTPGKVSTAKTECQDIRIHTVQY